MNRAIRSAPAILAASYFSVAAPPALAADPNKDSAPAVSVVQAKHNCFTDTLEVTGVVAPRRENLVRTPREGLQISQVLVQPGDTVISGQVLARMKQADGSAADTAVAAPAAGTIYAMSALVGATPSVAGDPLFSVAQNGDMELLVQTPVNTMSRLAVNQGASVDIIGVAGSIPAKVRSISNTIDQTTQLGEVRLQLNFDPRVRVGAFGAGKIELERRCGPAVPLSAVVYADEGAIVQVVRDDSIESRRVAVGSINSDDVEIRDGLAEGESVVARAGAFVRDGDRVRPVSAGKRTNTQ